MTLEANKDHFAAPKMNRWVLRFVANPEAVLGMMHSRRAQLHQLLRRRLRPCWPRSQEGPQACRWSSTIELGSRFLAYNMRRPPFDDVYFRQALSTVIDKDGMINGILQGRAIAAKSIISPSMKVWYDDTVKTWARAWTQAKALLKAHGYEWDAQGHLMYPAGKTETLPIGK